MDFDLNLILYVLFLLCMGSTLTAISYRWQHRAEFEWRKEAHEFLELPYYEPEPLKFSKGRSVCPHCHHRLSVIELIPLLSFILQKGRCRQCHKPISLRYPIIEATAVMALLPLYWLPLSAPEWGLLIVLISSLVCAMIIDAERYWLPDECSFVVLCCATLLFYAADQHQILVNVGAGLFAYLFIYFMRYLFFKIRKIEAIGLGDAKLLAVLVFWLGPHSFSMIMLLASLLGITGALVSGKIRHHKIPFGPYLITAALGYFYSGYFL
ncbi:Leader peptidase PppA [Marinomonas aquimarina]|uniref:Prepilin leader peptidase/N-methyltransferase n=1 Tax=Marinomonas aquimarina TaxID=295068 RepID=A0A1A8TDI4_9GAMM|nr:A24 family peptidase [Marinomonas aquimarina]SBS31239.1 Leader peptidase PppA [Marinomonas aquimarina]